jgi:hypothetical protein
MKRHTTMSIPDQLRRAGQLIGVSRTNPEIQALVAARGYGEAAFAEGQRLYDAAVQAVNTQNAKAGAQRLATEQARIAERAARIAYQNLAQTARALFPPNSPERKVLDLAGRVSDSTARLLAAAGTLFNNALNIPEIRARLEPYGYDQAALLRERNVVQHYAELLQAQANARSTAIRATAEQEAALAELHFWTAQYAKFARIALRGRPDLLRAVGLAPQRKAAAPAPKSPSPIGTTDGEGFQGKALPSPETPPTSASAASSGSAPMI